MAMSETARHFDDLRAILDAMRSGTPAPGDRLSAMARRFLASSPEGRGRIDPAGFAELLASELAGRFIHQRRSPDETQMARALAAALRRAQADIEDRTHFIPCRLFAGDGPEGLSIGPVGFRRSAAFCRDNGAPMAVDPGLAGLVREALGGWDWVAEVTVRGCDRVISRARAVKAADAALDMLRLFAGAEAARGLSRAGAEAASSPVPDLWADPSGRLHAGSGDRATAQEDFDGWLVRVHGGEGRDWLDRAGRCLEPLVEPALHWPLADRFREAASWFGEGVADNYAAARILAFVAAIERAVVPGDHADVWRAVTRRAAILAQRSEGGGREDWEHRAGRVYETRSQFVHGGLSPFAPEAEAMDGEAAALSRAVLTGALEFYEELGLTRPEISAERLERELRALEAGR